MNLKEFDYKQFLLEKGERVGVGVAVALMLLFVVYGLLWPSHGFFSGSPKDKADALNKVTKDVNNKLSNSEPGENDKPPPDSDKKKIPLDTTVVKAQEFALAGGLFVGRQKDKTTRRMPEVLSPQEGAVATTWANIDSYVPVFDQQTNTIIGFYCLKDAAKPGGGGTPGMPGLGGLAGGMPGMPGMTGGGMRGGRAMGMAGGGGNMPALGRPGKMQILEERKTYTPEAVLLRDIEKKGGTLMRQLRPVRMAIIAASFPYKEQLEEFQSKLHLSLDQVRQEQVKEVIKDPVTGKWTSTGKMAPAFRFLGVQVERRILDSAGNALQDWTPTDLGAAYVPWLVMTGKRFEPEKAKYAPISFPGLVMRPLLQFRENPQAGEADIFENKYPDVESKLAKIEQTLEALKSKDPAEIFKPPAAFDPTGFDAFNTAQTEPSARGADMGAGPGIPMPGGNQPRNPMGAGAAGANAGQQTIPEYCLIRLIDLTIDPGKTYQYRIKVRMANPNYENPDVADPSWAKAEELTAKDWYEIPQKVTVPPELMYYALDEKEVEASQGKKYQGPVTGDIPFGERSRRTWLQIHRWLGATPVKSMGNKLMLIGEWAVADRVVVFRGEYTDRGVRLELPVWSAEHNAFVLPVEPDGRTNKTRGFYVDFSHEGERQTILVDFEASERNYVPAAPANEDDTKMHTPAVSDAATTEVLLMDPDGKLLGHSTAIDSQDPQRIVQRDFSAKRVAKVKGQTQQTDPGATNDPFRAKPN
jgi:hypothetical protein